MSMTFEKVNRSVFLNQQDDLVIDPFTIRRGLSSVNETQELVSCYIFSRIFIKSKFMFEALLVLIFHIIFALIIFHG